MKTKIGTANVLTFSVRKQVTDYISGSSALSGGEATPFIVSAQSARVYVIAREKLDITGCGDRTEIQVWGYCMEDHAAKWIDLSDNDTLKFKRCCTCDSPLFPNKHVHGICSTCLEKERRSSSSSRSCRERKARYFASWGVNDGRMRNFYGTKRELINRLKRVSILTYADDLRVTEDEMNGKVLHDETTSGFFSAEEWFEMTGINPSMDSAQDAPVCEATSCSESECDAKEQHSRRCTIPVAALSDIFAKDEQAPEFVVKAVVSENSGGIVTLLLHHKLEWPKAHKHLSTLFPGASISLDNPVFECGLINVVFYNSHAATATSYRECFTVVFKGLCQWVSCRMKPFMRRKDSDQIS